MKMTVVNTELMKYIYKTYTRKITGKTKYHNYYVLVTKLTKLSQFIKNSQIGDKYSIT